jgi:hypothetical protein
MATIERICWRLREDDRELLMHLLLGDEIALDGPLGRVWLRPARERPLRRAHTSLLLRYESDEAAVVFYAIARTRVAMEHILFARAAVSVVHAEQVWGPFVERLGHRRTMGDGLPVWREETVHAGRPNVLVRRMTHPNLLIDRLMLRERARARARLEEAMAACAPPSA